MARTFKNFTARSVGVTGVNIYNPTTAGIKCTVIGMSIANLTAATIYVSVYLNASSANTYLVKNAVVPTGGALIPVGGDQKLVMEQNNSLYVISDTATSADVIVSVLELT